MPVDARIALGVRPMQIDNPTNQLAQILQMQAAQQQAAMGGIQLQREQRGLAEDDAIRALYAQGVDPSKPEGMQRLLAISPKAGMAMQKQMLDADNVRANIDQHKSTTRKNDAESRIKMVETNARDLIPVTTVEGAHAWYDAAVQRGEMPQEKADLFKQQVPTDPAGLLKWKQAELAKGVSVHDSMTMQQRAAEHKDTIQTQILGQDKTRQTSLETNALTNQTSRQNNAATVGASIYGHNLVNARAAERINLEKAAPKGTWDSERGIMIGRDNVAQPVMLDGKPIGPKAGAADKLTEDQGKATGWLVQAENAFGNMKSAMEANPKAAKPGINDAIGAIPSFGAGEALANSMRSPERQKFMQGSSSLSEALLRAATGAGVNKDEAKQKVQELTPVFGEAASTTEQKMKAIPLYIESLKVRAGPGAKRVEGIVQKATGGTGKFTYLGKAD